MSAQVLNLEAKHRQGGGDLASLADFTFTPGERVNAEIILTNPNLSLYCLDDATQQAIFAELPAEVDLAKAPFVYWTQYEQAQRLLGVPYDTFQQLAGTLPAVRQLIVIYISGRSGSTLLSHVFNQLDTVRSLAEPDVATQFVHLRPADGQRDVELRGLLDSTVRMLFKPTPFKTPTTYALKLRGEGLQVMDLYQATFPQAKNLFLYRDAVGFVASFYRVFSRGGELPESLSVADFLALFNPIFNQDLTPLTACLAADATQVSLPQQLTLWWLALMECYMAQYTRGIPILAVRYTDLVAEREQVLTAIFKYCGLSTAKVPETLGVYAYDSQAGTALARDNPAEGNTSKLSDIQLQEITTILQRYPLIKESDFVMPGTLSI